jgi:hypothetical protein
VNRFVEECRREWKRLGVPDAVADEMAAELEADLREAEAEGAPPVDVLGSAAYDPRSFAAAWAVERGVVQESGPSRRGHRRQVLLAAATAVFALTGIAGGLLMIVSDSSTSTRLTIASPVPPPSGTPTVIRLGPPIAYSPDGQSVVTYDLPAVRPATFPMLDARVATVETDDPAFDTRTAGLLLSSVGLAGVVALLLSWGWVAPGRRAVA